MGKGKKKNKGSAEREKQEEEETMRVTQENEDEEEEEEDEAYESWKSLVPVLYDWFTYHNILWPSLSCRWGPVIEQGQYKNRQRLYLSEQTDGSYPNTLMILNCDVVKPRVAAGEHTKFNEKTRSPFVRKYKNLIHPGEVNRIRELPQNSRIVATHTDSPDVLIWDLEAQPNRHCAIGAVASRPDVILTGHKENAEYALDMCPTEAFVLSGGRDKYVVLWNIEDSITSLGANSSESSPRFKKDIPKVGSRGVFQGHDATVEDVQFCPSSEQEFCSVGDDSCLILWDSRCGSNPVVKVEKAHDDDVHCVDWNAHNADLILTGSADNTVCMFDRRKLTAGRDASLVQKFEGHKSPVLSTQWCPDKASVFGSASEDGVLNIWDYEKVGTERENARRPESPGLFFQHTGHRGSIVDFHWSPTAPWTIASVSDDGTVRGGGGSLQIWRMIDLLYRPEEEVLEELENFREHLTECGRSSKSQKSSD